MANEIAITDITGGAAFGDGSGAEIAVASDSGPLTLKFSLEALSKLPISALNFLAQAKAKDPRASYFSIKTVEVRIGEDRTSPDALIFVVLPGSNARLAFEIPEGELSGLKTDIEAIETRRKLPVQGRGNN